MLVDIILMFTFYNSFNDPDLRLRFSSAFAIPSKDFVEENELKEININLSDADKIHFDRLYRDYTVGIVNVETDPFLAYYSKNNEWRKTHLTINGEKFDVKIKSHGRTPSGHKYGDHFSLAVKFTGDQIPFYSKRVNFIIYNARQLSSELIKSMAPKFGLYSPDFELVNVTIDNGKPYLYFVEERINEQFFLSRNLPMIIFNSGVDGSLIYSGTVDYPTLTSTLIDELEGEDHLSNDLKLQVKSDYQTFNKAIEENNYQVLEKYLDIQYMSRLNAFRTVYGSTGHGFSPVNLEMAYDTIARKFYPIIHRDVLGVALEDCRNPYPFMDNKSPFWQLLNSNKAFRKLTSEQLDSFLIKYSNESIKMELDQIHSYYKEAFVYEFSYNNKNYSGYWILNNMDCLRK